MTSRSVQWPLASLIWLAGRTARRHAIGNDRYPQAGGPLPVGRADLSTARAPAPLHYRMAIDAPPAGWPGSADRATPEAIYRAPDGQRNMRRKRR